MLRIILFIFLTAMAALMGGCYYDVEEKIYPTLECDTAAVTYSLTVQPLIENRCYTCHSASINTGNVNLEDFSELIKYVDSGQLLGTINHVPGYPQMPQNRPKLVECEISKIEAWVAAGAKND